MTNHPCLLLYGIWFGSLSVYINYHTIGLYESMTNAMTECYNYTVNDRNGTQLFIYSLYPSEGRRLALARIIARIPEFLAHVVGTEFFTWMAFNDTTSHMLTTCQLVKQRSRTPCIAGHTFSCVGEQLLVSGGCRGNFNCLGSLLSCGDYSAKEASCLCHLVSIPLAFLQQDHLSNNAAVHLSRSNLTLFPAPQQGASGGKALHSAAVAAAVAHRHADAMCSPIEHVQILLPADASRRGIYEDNRVTLRSNLRFMRAVDGQDHQAALTAWRALGIKFVRNHASTRHSYGQFACTLSKLYLLAWQVRVASKIRFHAWSLPSHPATL